jgi:hypothetical protein
MNAITLNSGTTSTVKIFLVPALVLLSTSLCHSLVLQIFLVLYSYTNSYKFPVSVSSVGLLLQQATFLICFAVASNVS